MARTNTRSAPLPERAREDLMSSGLSPTDLLKSGSVEPVAPKDLLRYLPGIDVSEVESALLFRYYHLNGKGLEPLEYTDYCRAKIYYKPPTGFAANLEKDARPKYLQRTGTPVKLYIPPNINWDDYRREGAMPLVVTEGEKKALAAAAAGVHCVALGGVNSSGNRARDEVILPELVELARGRDVIIVFDVDRGHTTLKPQVGDAALRLARLLVSEAAANPYICVLPSDGSNKMALDDFVRTTRDEHGMGLVGKLYSYSVREAYAKPLLEESQEFCYIEESAAVGRVSTRFLHAEGNYFTMRGTQQVVLTRLGLSKDGIVTPRPEVLTLGRAWLAWPGRQSAKRADYVPGRTTVVEDGIFNTWRGWANKPHRARLSEIAPFTKALKYLHGKDWEYMFDWYMYPLANPGAKLFTIPILQSEHEGIGKSVIPSMLARHVYGLGIDGKPRNSWILNANSIEGGQSRLEFAAESQFILLDDMADLKRAMPLLKGVATQDTLALNEKYVRQRSVRNCINVMVTTNRTNPMPVTDLDRRFYYPHIEEKKNDELWKKEFIPFMQQYGGRLIGYAQHEWLETRGRAFDPTLPAPKTEKKEEMVILSESDLDTWAKDLATRADLCTREVATARELTFVYMQECGVDDHTKVHNVMFARAMKIAGIVRHAAVRVKVDGRTEVVYVLRTGSQWVHASQDAVRKELARVDFKIRDKAPRRA